MSSLHLSLTLALKRSLLTPTFGPPAKTGEMAAFVTYSHFQLTAKVGDSIQLNSPPTLKMICFSFTSVSSNYKCPLRSH